MLKTLLLVLIVSVSACSAASTTVELNADDRFDLMPFNMEPIMISDVKKCIEISHAVKNYKTGGSRLVQKSFNLGVDFWAHVDNKFSKESNLPYIVTKNVVLLDGEGKNIPSIFPEKSNRAKKSELCGEYAGGAIVKLGLMSLADTIELAEEAQPGLLEKLGYDLENLLAGVVTINKRASNLGSMQANDMISCVAVYQALRFNDVKFIPYSNIWVAALVRAIEAGKISAHEFGDGSLFWSALTSAGPASINNIDGATEFIQQCENWLNEAIAPQEASNQ